jgi:SAM-dependent methyltransferase
VSQADNIVELYARRAADWDADRGRDLFERPWLDRFLAHVPEGGTVLDLGCGMGEPIAAYLIGQGRRVFGVDSAPGAIDLCRARFHDQEWLAADMRALDLRRRFDGVLAWHSFFHLDHQAQRAMFPIFALHAAPGAPLMFTSGWEEGVAMGEWRGEPLYHASLDTAEYRALLETNGFEVLAHVVQDPDCGHATIWLARKT